MRLPISDQYRLQTYLISCTFRDIAFDGSKIVIFAHLLRLTLPNQSINQLINQSTSSFIWKLKSWIKICIRLEL